MHRENEKLLDVRPGSDIFYWQMLAITNYMCYDFFRRKVLHMDQRKNEIKSAYKSLGKAHSLYDGMMTGSTVLGKLILKAVWQMDKEDALEYQARAFEMLASDFKGKLLEVPVGTGVLSMPIWKTLPEADITCLDYSEKMMESASQRAREMGINNVSFKQGDVGKLPYEDNTFDVGHTKAWLIPGTEDLMPYIHKKTWIKKIVLTIILYPLLAAIIAGIVTLIM